MGRERGKTIRTHTHTDTRHALLLSSSRQSRALFLPPASWHLTDKDKLVELFSVVLYVA